jgi:hypothetical protein
VRRYTIDVLDRLAAASAIASSTIAFSGTCLPPRSCSSAVITITAPAPRCGRAGCCAEKPPKTTEWVAPMRAQACIATTPSTTSDVDRDAVALLHAARLQRVGQAAGARKQLAVARRG